MENEIVSNTFIVNKEQEYDVTELNKKIHKNERKINSLKDLQKTEPDDETLSFWNEMHKFEGHIENLKSDKKKYEDLLEEHGYNSNKDSTPL